LKLVGSGKALAPASQAVDVVLTGTNIPKDVARGISGIKTKVVSAATGDASFTIAANRSRNVQVIVVDADQYGLGLIHDLRTVFPTVKLIALSDDPRKLARAVAAGASIALPRSSPSASLAKVVSRLALGATPTARH
jgi:DNA-binding NarL/FixJ family response regulator